MSAAHEPVATATADVDPIGATVTLHFAWPYDGSEVRVAGVFDDWKGETQLTRAPAPAAADGADPAAAPAKTHATAALAMDAAVLREKVGDRIALRREDAGVAETAEVLFKFIVDGVWRHDGEAPAAQDAAGVWNNVLRVPLPPVDAPRVAKAAEPVPAAADAPTAADAAPDLPAAGDDDPTAGDVLNPDTNAGTDADADAKPDPGDVLPGIMDEAKALDEAEADANAAYDAQEAQKTDPQVREAATGIPGGAAGEAAEVPLLKDSGDGATLLGDTKGHVAAHLRLPLEPEMLAPSGDLFPDAPPPVPLTREEAEEQKDHVAALPTLGAAAQPGHRHTLLPLPAAAATAAATAVPGALPIEAVMPAEPAVPDAPDVAATTAPMATTGKAEDMPMLAKQDSGVDDIDDRQAPPLPAASTPGSGSASSESATTAPSFEDVYAPETGSTRARAPFTPTCNELEAARRRLANVPPPLVSRAPVPEDVLAKTAPTDAPPPVPEKRAAADAAADANADVAVEAANAADAADADANAEAVDATDAKPTDATTTTTTATVEAPAMTVEAAIQDAIQGTTPHVPAPEDGNDDDDVTSALGDAGDAHRRAADAAPQPPAKPANHAAPSTIQATAPTKPEADDDLSDGGVESPGVMPGNFTPRPTQRRPLPPPALADHAASKPAAPAAAAAAAPAPAPAPAAAPASSGVDEAAAAALSLEDSAVPLSPSDPFDARHSVLSWLAASANSSASAASAPASAAVGVGGGRAGATTLTPAPAAARAPAMPFPPTDARVPRDAAPAGAPSDVATVATTDAASSTRDGATDPRPSAFAAPTAATARTHSQPDVRAGAKASKAAAAAPPPKPMARRHTHHHPQQAPLPRAPPRRAGPPANASRHAQVPAKSQPVPEFESDLEPELESDSGSDVSDTRSAQEPHRPSRTSICSLIDRKRIEDGADIGPNERLVHGGRARGFGGFVGGFGDMRRGGRLDRQRRALPAALGDGHAPLVVEPGQHVLARRGERAGAEALAGHDAGDVHDRRHERHERVRRVAAVRAAQRLVGVHGGVVRAPRPRRRAPLRRARGVGVGGVGVGRGGGRERVGDRRRREVHALGSEAGGERVVAQAMQQARELRGVVEARRAVAQGRERGRQEGRPLRARRRRGHERRELRARAQQIVERDAVGGGRGRPLDVRLARRGRVAARAGAGGQQVDELGQLGSGHRVRGEAEHAQRGGVVAGRAGGGAGRERGDDAAAAPRRARRRPGPQEAPARRAEAAQVRRHGSMALPVAVGPAPEIEGVAALLGGDAERRVEKEAREVRRVRRQLGRVGQHGEGRRAEAGEGHDGLRQRGRGDGDPGWRRRGAVRLDRHDDHVAGLPIAVLRGHGFDEPTQRPGV
ncbi:hypothetical protein CXG81DRAFT_18607 [Caulochytrium protostelioides]|uniref:AMP-activated protein kinase glycogen-binding domain-containing protein n=1 Tax=Caulochytrium protostelioides TaxID=1555241 RepID=A0A4P9X8L5_9FUNG|nr:hypothetical protein CXG81DRAFT_18607 [Caulochytrium protostelioides]|eukprot:RKP01608.1 hypothetical protein CXG81DRAFT_18607 [Caulochytrium protostelioides]